MESRTVFFVAHFMVHWHFELQIANANKQQQGLREVLAVDGDGSCSCYWESYLEDHFPNGM